MKISLDWLQDFIALKVTNPHEIARRVTAGVAEVNEVEIQGALLDCCVVGKLLYFRKHPNADKLQICDVQTDTGLRKVICGGTNLCKGMRVAFAHIGATVRWHGTELQTLRRVAIRGEESEGMICTAEELDLLSRFPESRERVVIDLGDSDEGVGLSLKEFFGVGDTVLHIDNHAITHRVDLFSHLGFAREFVSLGLAQWKGDKGGKRDKRGKGDLKFPSTPLPFQCIVESKHLVPRYASCLFTVDGVGETPGWMKKRLEATGWRSVSLPVDITNYVLMELGSPLHCFDADDIRGDPHIRLSKDGEEVTTLDGQTRKLAGGCLVISDDEGIFDLLGIMGGLRSSMKETTKRMYLQAAILDPVSIRRGILATGHRTDGATVYEKGVPQCIACPGLLRAVGLFLSLVPGCTLASRLEEWGDNGKAKPITLPLERVSSILGTNIPEKKIVKILEDLEFEVKMKRLAASGKRIGSRSPLTAQRSLIVTPPLHRLGDIHGPHDLIEEVGRIAGYNEISPAMPVEELSIPSRDPRMHTVRDALVARGFTEVVPISLVSESLLRRSGLDPADAVEIHNPLGVDMKLLQTSTLPGLLEHAQRNLLNADDWISTFHLAHVFAKGEAPLRPPSADYAGRAEHAELGILLADLQSRKEELLMSPVVFLKSSLAAALRSAGYELDAAVAGSIPPNAHPGRFAELLIRPVSSDGNESRPFTRIGMLYELHPSIAASFDLRHRCAVAFLDLAILLAIPVGVPIAKPVPAFPAVRYDYTENVRHTQSVGDVLKRLRGSHEHLESVEVKDLYSGPDTGKNSYNLTLTFTYRAKDRTLTEEEAKQAHEKVLAAIR